MQQPLLIPHTSTLSLFRNKVAIHFQDLVRIEGRGNYTEFVMQNGKTMLSSKTISYYEPLLPPFFLKVKKGCIINGYHLMTTQRARVDTLRMLDGTWVEVSRRNRAIVKSYCVQMNIILSNSAKTLPV